MPYLTYTLFCKDTKLFLFEIMNLTTLITEGTVNIKTEPYKIEKKLILYKKSGPRRGMKNIIIKILMVLIMQEYTNPFLITSIVIKRSIIRVIKEIVQGGIKIAPIQSNPPLFKEENPTNKPKIDIIIPIIQILSIRFLA